MQHRACLTWLLRCFCASAVVVLAPIAIAAEEGQHGRPSVLGGDLGNVFFTLLIFGLLVVSLGKLAWKPLLRVLQQREEFIRDSIDSARREREEADKLLAEYRTQIDHAREEATAIVEEGKRDAGDVARRVQAEARKEGEEMIARARREIQLAKDTAVKELYDRTAELAVQVAGRVVGKTLSADEHRALVAESLERMKSSDEAKLN
ncbi:MAG TPA: F0F1 ATP synthase subunit B [Phycisphaerae bacterium]|nr:F0F1 ATP synthase subunit B [Phycisphaerae bacterium]